MDSLLHTGGAVLTAIFVLAALYSLYTTIKKKARQEKRDNSLSGRKHMHVENLHKYDVQPRNGYICYPVDIKGYTHRFPARFVAVSLSQATKQPYSVYKIGYAEFEKDEITDRNYFYIQPPENDLTCVTDPDVSWQVLAKADTFGEYWQAGMNRVFEDTIIVAHNAPYVIGCILHSLTVYGIHPESLRYVDLLETAKELYDFNTNSLAGICTESGFETEAENELSQAVALGQFFLLSRKDYPTALPRIYAVGKAPAKEEIMAAAIAAVEREEDTAAEMFAPAAADEALLREMLANGYIEKGEKPATYYATDKGLDFAAATDL